MDITRNNEQIGFQSQQIRKEWKKPYNDTLALFGDIFVQPYIVC